MSSQFQNDEFKERVRSATDLVGLIGEVVTLQPVRGGQEYLGLCPFHDDHTPSFRVYPDRQSFRCWACQAGGDCFQFVMLRERATFPEALEMLAERARIELPRRNSRDEGGGGGSGDVAVSKSQMYAALNWAEQLFHDCLLKQPAGREAREYLASRHLTGETIQEFRLGYHPDNWQWVVDQAHDKFPLVQLLAARIIGKNDERNRYYDEFVDRVMFPIHDQQGRTVAFGGRILPGHDDKMGKYRNSLESSLFTKSRVIFGLNKARAAIVEQDLAVVVEGYMDCIAAHQCGLKNVVATLGTALTEHHVTTLKRLTRHCVLMFDGDKAGQDSAEKSLPRFMAQELDLRIFVLTGDLDPDEAYREYGADWFRDQLRRAPEPWEYKLARVLRRQDVNTLDGAQRVLDEMLDFLCVVPTFLGSLPTGGWKLREDMLLGKLAQRLGVAERSVRDRLQYFRKQREQRSQATAANRTAELVPDPAAEQVTRLMKRPTTEQGLELELIEIAILNPHQIQELRQKIVAEDLSEPLLREIWELCLKLTDDGQVPGIELLLTTVEELHLKQLLVWLDETARRKGVSLTLLEHTLDGLRRRRVSAQRAQLQDGAGPTAQTQPTNPGSDNEWLRRVTELNQQRIERNRSL